MGEEEQAGGAEVLKRVPRGRWLAVLRWLATLAFASAGIVLAIQGQQLFLAHPPNEDAAIAHYIIGAGLFAFAFVWQRGHALETVASRCGASTDGSSGSSAGRRF